MSNVDNRQTTNGSTNTTYIQAASIETALIEDVGYMSRIVPIRVSKQGID